MITNDEIKDWFEELERAKKRDKQYHDRGEDILEIYNADSPDKVPFNILYSNTETLVPALYSQTPRPVVKRRQNQKKGAEALTLAVERASTRMLEYLIDTNIGDAESFDDSMTNAVLDAALPGRGITEFSLDAEVDEMDNIYWATVNSETKQWNRVYLGYAKKWSKVPYIFFEEYITEETAREMYGDEIANQLRFTDKQNDENSFADAAQKDEDSTALIYVIWDKRDRTVKHICQQYDGYMRVDNDPLGIAGFYPIPKPLQFHKKSNSMMVTALYSLYENQAKELNRLTLRLNKVIEAIKVRGVYDGNFGDELENIFTETDNALVPTEKAATFMEGGFDRHIWLMPVETLAGVAQQLYQAREQCKQVIYEITGISDILRGSSKASETLGAQQIKQEWGAMRIKNHQKAVQQYARDSLRLMLDIAVENIPLSLWQNICDLDIPTQEEKDQALGEVMAAPYTKQEPKVETIAISESPSWEEVMEVLQDDYIRSFRIDIETNSTLDVEATDDKKQVGEFMNAMAQFMNGMAPFIQQGIMPFEAMKAMLLAITQRYRFGREVEEQLKAMSEPQMDEKTAQAQKQLKEAQQKFDEERERVGQELDSQVQKLQADRMQFDYDKKLAAEQDKFRDKAFQLKQDSMQSEMELMFKDVLETNKREVQSMIDKVAARFEKGGE